MEITEQYKPSKANDWRNWLQENHKIKKEIWLVRDKSQQVITYIDSVYEAICFGWIDSTSKKINENETAQRFTPRRKNGNWTELNKERARYLIKNGKMTPEGLKMLPDLNQEFVIPEHIIISLKNAKVWEKFQEFPEIYKRIRISYINEYKPGTEEYENRLSRFIIKTNENKMFGNWTDNGKLK